MIAQSTMTRIGRAVRWAESQQALSGALPAGPGVPLWFPFGPASVFGLDVNWNVVTVRNAQLRRYGDQVYTCADAAVTFSDGPGQRIIWQWSPDSGLQIQSTPQTNPPADDSDYVRGEVAIFDCANGQCTLNLLVQCGIIHLPVNSKATT